MLPFKMIWTHAPRWLLLRGRPVVLLPVMSVVVVLLLPAVLLLPVVGAGHPVPRSVPPVEVAVLSALPAVPMAVVSILLPVLPVARTLILPVLLPVVQGGSGSPTGDSWGTIGACVRHIDLLSCVAPCGRE